MNRFENKKFIGFFIAICFGLALLGFLLVNPLLKKSGQKADVQLAAADRPIQNAVSEPNPSPTPAIAPNGDSTVSLTTQSPASNADNPERCSYNGQNYSAGDIVKTEEGWIRCTPSIIFSAANPLEAQASNPVWTKVQ